MMTLTVFKMDRIIRLLLVGMICTLLNATQRRASATDYRAPGLSTELDAPTDLHPENFRVLTEGTMSNSRALLEVGADVRNLTDAFWEGVRVYIRDEIAGVAPEALNSIIHF